MKLPNYRMTVIIFWRWLYKFFDGGSPSRNLEREKIIRSGEPVHIKEILPDVMQDIRRRIELNRQAKVLSAVGDYLSHKKKRTRAKEKSIFEPMKKIANSEKIMLDK